MCDPLLVAHPALDDERRVGVGQQTVPDTAGPRGRESNRLYVDTYYDPDHDTSHGPLRPRPAEDVLAVVLGNVGADISAHTILANEMRTAESIPTLAAEYLTIARAAQAARWDATDRPIRTHPRAS